MPRFTTLLVGLACLLNAAAASAHFQTLLPSRDIVTAATGRAIDLDIRFTHPMEWGPVMEMKTPTRFGVIANGRTTDLGKSLVARKLSGATAYTSRFTVAEPADYLFFIDPAPYWEPAEQKMIIHYTKVVVDAFGAEEGWDAATGQPVEIMPLVRPYGLWTGNIFRGVVTRNGQPVPHAEIEVEYYNENKKVKIPADPFVTQVIKADEHGVFAYAMPKGGWWGFAALVDGEPMPGPDGKPVAVELGGLIWVRVQDMK
ncbi:MAG: DUF4198 domain-containing protein [Desulfobulbaceae bacterium]|nr:DUF4198 domain-containing protein [Desulfobulbaceae bacterium]